MREVVDVRRLSLILDKTCNSKNYGKDAGRFKVEAHYGWPERWSLRSQYLAEIVLGRKSNGANGLSIDWSFNDKEEAKKAVDKLIAAGFYATCGDYGLSPPKAASDAANEAMSIAYKNMVNGDLDHLFPKSN